MVASQTNSILTRSINFDKYPPHSWAASHFHIFHIFIKTKPCFTYFQNFVSGFLVISLVFMMLVVDACSPETLYSFRIRCLYTELT